MHVRDCEAADMAAVTAIYAGYNTDYENLALLDDGAGPRLVRTDGDLINDSRQLFFKVSYLFRP